MEMKFAQYTSVRTTCSYVYCTYPSPAPSETLNHTLPRSPSPIASSLLPLITSLPTYATTTLLNDREPPHLSDNHLVKAPPPPKPVTETEGVQGNVSTNGMLRRDEEKLASAMQSSDVTGCVQDMTSPTFRAQSLQHRLAGLCSLPLCHQQFSY